MKRYKELVETVKAKKAAVAAAAAATAAQNSKTKWPVSLFEDMSTKKIYGITISISLRYAMMFFLESNLLWI